MQVKNYSLVQSEYIDELRANLCILKHDTSGAHLIHIHNDDPENVFCLSLSTYPSNSSGVAHILEHMVLCGSKKYPVKDPFFSMIRRSLNTFMNAFTGSDFTCYPAASQNRVDFYNLLDVYIDAVFFPNLDERSFLQEGHRLDLQDHKNLKGLIRSGIVYNEMKGAYVSPETHLWKKIHEQLLCDTCYHFDSGGDPKCIPTLTHEQLLAFHQTYYHPSRCLYFFYGNINTIEHADFLHQRLLAHVQPAQALEPRANQPRWISPRNHYSTYPSSADDSNSEDGHGPIAAFSWLTHPIQSTRSNLLLDLLDYLLMGHDGAPLKRFLLESGLCRHCYSSIDHEMVEIPYSLILRDCTSPSLEDIQQIIMHKLHEIYAEGFSSQAIASALHQLKISRLEITGGGYPFGLTLFFRSGLAMQQGADPIDSLKLHSHFDSLKHLPDDSSELMHIFEQSLLKNPHRLNLWLAPDKEWAQQEQQEEAKKLQELEMQLSLEQKQKISQQAKTLEELQNQEDDKELLPKIAIASIHRYSQNFPLEAVSNHIYGHTCFTNGFIYNDLHLHLDQKNAATLSSQQWHELKILTYLWPRLGASSRNYEQQLQLLDLHSAGLSCSLQFLGRYENVPLNSHALPSIVFSIHGLEEKSCDFIPLLEQTLFEGRLDEQARISQLMDTLHSSLVNQLPASALQYAISASSASLSPISGMSDWVNGLEFVRFVCRESQSLKQGRSNLIDRLKALKDLILRSSHPVSVVGAADSGLKASIEHLNPTLSKFKKELSVEEMTLVLPSLAINHSSAYALNSQVSFNALSLPGPNLHHPDAMSLRLACEVIKQQVLHSEIREKGGAYGYGCSWNPEKETITFHSYRDPHITRTLEVFKQGAQKIASGEFTQEDLDEAKRCWIQKLDKPLSPGDRASTSYNWLRSGLSLEQRNDLRIKLLDATLHLVAQSAGKWLVDKWDQHRVCLFGPRPQILQETKWDASNPLNPAT